MIICLKCSYVIKALSNFHPGANSLPIKTVFDTISNLKRTNKSTSRLHVNRASRESSEFDDSEKNGQRYYSIAPNNKIQCENSHKYSIFGNYMKVKSTNPLRDQLLKEFLCIKYFQHYDIINYLSIGEFRNKFNIKILEAPKNDHKGMYKHLEKHGPDQCDLNTVARAQYDTYVSVCPWHWLITERFDRYPFKLPIAKCNCHRCQARTLFDSDRYKMSSCVNNFALKPVLFREYDLADTSDQEEVWIFSLEEVPVSCSCSVNLNPY